MNRALRSIIVARRVDTKRLASINQSQVTALVALRKSLSRPAVNNQL
jgi:hypothetical protein